MSKLLLLALVAYGLSLLIRKIWNDSPRPELKPVPEPIPFERSPYRTLGLEEGASTEAIENAMSRIRTENDSLRLEGLSEEIRDTAKRRLQDAEKAYRSLVADDP